LQDNVFQSNAFEFCLTYRLCQHTLLQSESLNSMDHNSYVQSYTVHCDAKTFSNAFLYSSFIKAKSVERMAKI